MTGRLLSLVLLCWSSAAWALDRPHILWLTAEDLSPRLGCYGDATVPTPNLDRLADEGVRFTRAFTATGVCAPCRHTIITGLYPMQSGCAVYAYRVKVQRSRRDQGPGTAPRGDGSAGVRGDTAGRGALLYRVPPCRGVLLHEQQQAGLSVPGAGHRLGRVVAPGALQEPRTGQPFFAVFNQTVTHESGVHGKLFIHETRGAIGPCPSANEKRCSDKGFRPTPLPNYLQLLDWTVRQTLADKRGSTQEGQAHVFGGKSKDVAKSARRKMSQTLT